MLRKGSQMTVDASSRLQLCANLFGVFGLAGVRSAPNFVAQVTVSNTGELQYF